MSQLAMPNPNDDTLTSAELDMCWAAMRAYAREQARREDDAEADLADALSKKLHRLRNAQMRKEEKT